MKKLSLLFAVVLVTCLVFTVSCINKEVQVTETYYETEYRTESYVEIGKEQRDYITSKWERYAPMYFRSLEWAKAGAESHIDGYEIDTAKLSKSQVKLILLKNPQASLWGILVINLTGIGPLSEPPPQSGLAVNKMVEGEVKYISPPAEQQWLDNLNAIMTDPKHFLCFTRSDQHTGPDIIVDVTGVEEFAVITCNPPRWLESPGPVIEKVQLISHEEVTKDRQIPYQVEKQRTVTKTEKVPFWEIWTNPSTSSIIEVKPVVEAPSPPTLTTKANPPSPQIIYDDDFSKPNSGFSTTVESNYKDGEYNVLVNGSDYFIWRYNIRAGLFSDFTLAIDARLVNDSNRGFYGIIFRAKNNDNFYYLQIATGGGYMIGERFNGSWTTLQPWTTSEYINKDFGVNHIEVICKESLIEVNINGRNLTTIDDPNHFTSGYVGVIVYSPAGNVHAAFDNLKVYTSH